MLSGIGLSRFAEAADADPSGLAGGMAATVQFKRGSLPEES